jgi:hypothetical protein
MVSELKVMSLNSDSIVIHFSSRLNVLCLGRHLLKISLSTYLMTNQLQKMLPLIIFGVDTDEFRTQNEMSLLIVDHQRRL